jgi:hypothetical protein
MAIHATNDNTITKEANNAPEFPLAACLLLLMLEILKRFFN